MAVLSGKRELRTECGWSWLSDRTTGTIDPPRLSPNTHVGSSPTDRRSQPGHARMPHGGRRRRDSTLSVRGRPPEGSQRRWSAEGAIRGHLAPSAALGRPQARSPDLPTPNSEKAKESLFPCPRVRPALALGSRGSHCGRLKNKGTCHVRQDGSIGPHAQDRVTRMSC